MTTTNNKQPACRRGRQTTKLTEKEVEHVAKLANLSLKGAEIEKFQKQLSAILGYVEILNQVQTAQIEPTSQVTGLENVLRKDEPGVCLSQAEALSGAKSKKEGMFKIKAIFK